MEAKETNIEEIIDSLSPLERKVVPFLSENFSKIQEKSGLDNISALRALRFLESKGAIKLTIVEKNTAQLSTNGIYYKKNHLPERRLLMVLEEQPSLELEEAKKTAKLSENEFRVSIGVLKQKNLATLENGKIKLIAKKEQLIQKFPEEHLIELLPLALNSMTKEQMLILEQLKKRKEIVEISKQQEVEISILDLGKKLSGKEIRSDLIEEVTPEIIKSWNKQKKFRKYDIKANVPKVYPGKRHFVNQAIEYARNIWIELGFTELEGPMADSSFWVFDSLFTPQDHPAREMQDTFFIKESSSTLPNQEIVNKVKLAHEKGVAGSTGWKYSWTAQKAEKNVLRTHTTGLSARALSNIDLKKLPQKYFAIGKVFRNETVDWKHGFEFYQTEGIVIDKNANLSHLLGYLKLFYSKMGFEKIRFRPSFFAYTEPSVEIEVFHPERKEWIELGGAGIFRPEVVVPLLGEYVPVLAWGQGFDRIIMDYYKIKDLREMYNNDIKQLREKRSWL
ncbi:MAG TPA: phenylalanine--tRNA ligase subunit alpha [Candidatus Nanoarchaeia archaeon]|nr:phenylalanine--tRNA ligase subunit alpha [Candidatus Nanoarchaeia archaeon]